jgi:hypothetical protein
LVLWHFYCFILKVFNAYGENKLSLVGGLAMTIKAIDKHDFDILILILSVICEIIFFMAYYGF